MKFITHLHIAEVDGLTVIVIYRSYRSLVSSSSTNTEMFHKTVQLHHFYLYLMTTVLFNDRVLRICYESNKYFSKWRLSYLE